VSDALISVVLPVHNQADHILPVVMEYELALAELPQPHEFILVVNACHDRSLDVCHSLAARLATTRVVYSDIGGWGRAVKTGLKEARGDLLCYTNSARTSAADLLLLILYAITNPGAVVKAHRRSRESLQRRIGSFLFNLQCRGLFDLPTWDINATPKVFSREIYETIQPVRDDDLLDLEVYVKCKQLGTTILEVPIYSRPRHGGRSTTTYRTAMELYWGAFQMWRAFRRGSGSHPRAADE